ncbi:MAG TPA: hypothetical protein VG297_05165, partial [Bryobacteraceae bacterium]|nr:hypothetical protein [Bryobacteraceae bacterium]
VDCWLNHYKPEDDEVAAALVAELARSHWFLKRAVKRVEEVEFNLPANADHWTDDQQKRFANFLRYKTTAERSFLRFYKEVESYYDKQSKKEQIKVRASARRAAIEARFLREVERLKTFQDLRLTQWADVTTDASGNCVTTCVPTNQQLLDKVAESPSEPVFVVRFLNFHGPLPSEYAWLNPNHLQQAGHTTAKQILWYQDWRKLIGLEAETRAGHLGPVCKIT